MYVNPLPPTSIRAIGSARPPVREGTTKCYHAWQHNYSWVSTGGGYVFITWKGDHPPRHVHVYRDGRLVVKWDLDNQRSMKGTATRRVLQLIVELELEGVL